jgi:hypothetical protein
MLSELLLSDGTGIIEARGCFGCRGNVFTCRCLLMDGFSDKIFWPSAEISQYVKKVAGFYKPPLSVSSK